MAGLDTLRRRRPGRTGCINRALPQERGGRRGAAATVRSEDTRLGCPARDLGPERVRRLLGLAGRATRDPKSLGRAGCRAG